MNEGKIFRIIDANLNRATEGMRVVEEICRFILEDEKLTLQVKKIRGSLGKAMRACEGQGRRGGLKARKAMEDVGRETYIKQEGERAGIDGIFRANMKRAEEAVRCLEEFSKLLNPEYGRKFKAIRFKLYELETRISLKVEKVEKLAFNIYVVTDPKLGHLKMIRQALKNGIKLIQLRDKFAPKPEYTRLAKQAVRLAHRAGASLILNDHYDLVKETGADGVHLGQSDLRKISLKKLRGKLGEDKLIGVSAGTFSEAKRAQKLGADYLGVGPIFATPNKPTVKPVGLKVLARIVSEASIPVVAIGGINRTNLNKIRSTGCQRVAVISGAEELGG